MLCHVHKELYGAAPPNAARSAAGSSKLTDKKRKKSVVTATCKVCDERTVASDMTKMHGDYYCANCIERDDSD
jgi:late competence protein required for DNA uptake (superfamily II DNA/RNA helicase)